MTFASATVKYIPCIRVYDNQLWGIATCTVHRPPRPLGSVIFVPDSDVENDHGQLF